MNNQLLQILKASGNPQQYAYNQLKQMAGNNPMIQSALDGNAESIVRNMCKEKGIDADNLYNQMINSFR